MSIRLFDKTPKGIVCPHFYILSWARGCPYDCSYCYLALTHRFQGNTPHFYTWARIEKAIDKFFKIHEEPAILNTGELSDSLMNPKLMEKICDKFETQETHKVLLLSKGCHWPEKQLICTEGTSIDFLRVKRYKQTVVSFSINAHEFAEVYEKRAPRIYERLEAARTLGNFGYEVRIRIDPIIPLKPPESSRNARSWKLAYRSLIKFMLNIMFVTPSRITLGTPRWFPALPYWLSRADREDNFFQNFRNNRELCCDRRYRLRNRVQAYIYVIKWLRKYGYRGPISLCKETVDVWHKLDIELGILSEEIRCNCTL